MFKPTIVIMVALIISQISYSRERRKDCPEGSGVFCAQYQCLNIVTGYGPAKDAQEAANDYQFIMPIREFGIGNRTLMAADDNSYYIFDEEQVAVLDKTTLKDGKKYLYPLANFGQVKALPSGRKKTIDSVAVSLNLQENKIRGEDTASTTTKETIETPQIYRKTTTPSKVVSVKLKLEEELVTRITAGKEKLNDHESDEVTRLSTGTLKELAEDLSQCQKALKVQSANRSPEENKFLLAADSELNSFIDKANEILSYRGGNKTPSQKSPSRIGPKRER